MSSALPDTDGYSSLFDFRMGQAAPQHLQPPQAVHPPVAAAALSAVHQGGASSASAVHQPPPHQAGASAAPPGNQMAQVPPVWPPVFLFFVLLLSRGALFNPLVLLKKKTKRSYFEGKTALLW